MTAIQHANEAQVRYHTAQVVRYAAEAITAAHVAEIAHRDPDVRVYIAASALAEYAYQNECAARCGLKNAKLIAEAA